MSDATDQASVCTPDAAVLATIPHRPPFLLIDRIVESEPGQSAQSAYQVRHDNPVFSGHFPNFQVFPGVLVLENMAQTACCVLASQTPDDNALYVLVRVNQCTYQRMVRPGDELNTRMRLTRRFDKFAQFEGEVMVGGECVARAELLVARQ